MLFSPVLIAPPKSVALFSENMQLVTVSVERPRVHSALPNVASFFIKILFSIFIWDLGAVYIPPPDFSAKLFSNVLFTDSRHEVESVHTAPPNCFAKLSLNVLFMITVYVLMSEHIAPPSPNSKSVAELPLNVQLIIIAEQYSSIFTAPPWPAVLSIN